jgi:hypothetical protein
MEIDRPEALESCRLDNASGSSLSVVMNRDFDGEDEAAKKLGGDGSGGGGGGGGDGNEHNKGQT